MGKRSSFERVPRDFYPTPAEAVAPLLPHLMLGTRFCEPCAGDGALINHLEASGHHCAVAWDIEPKRDDIWQHDALTRLVGNTGSQFTESNGPAVSQGFHSPNIPA